MLYRIASMPVRSAGCQLNDPSLHVAKMAHISSIRINTGKAPRWSSARSVG